MEHISDYALLQHRYFFHHSSHKKYIITEQQKTHHEEASIVKLHKDTYSASVELTPW